MELVAGKLSACQREKGHHVYTGQVYLALILQSTVDCGIKYWYSYSNCNNQIISDSGVGQLSPRQYQ